MANIIVDLRSLHSAQASGVEHATVHLLERLLASDTANHYQLYYNGWRRKRFDQFHFVNVTFRQTRIPNRLLNLSLGLLGFPKLEALTGSDSGHSSVLFMPNPSAVALRSTTKLVLMVHDLSPVVLPEMHSLKSRIWHRLINLRKLANRADKILAVSEFTKQTLISQLGVNSDKIVVAPLAVDKERFHPDIDVSVLRSVRNRYSLPGEFVLFVGTIEPRKNLSRLITAFEQLDSDAHLVLAGKLGWGYHQLLHQIEQSPKRKQIHYIGYVYEDDKPALFKLAKVLAWPSLYEGFGLPPLEAASVGTPVLTSNVSSLPEVMGDSALLVNPYNIEEITRGLNELLTQDLVRDQYIQRGLARAKKYDWQTCADRLKGLLI